MPQKTKINPITPKIAAEIILIKKKSMPFFSIMFK